MKNLIIMLHLGGFMMFAFASHAQTVTDIDGNIYDTLHIGTQVWLKQNLKTTRYKNGDAIAEITSNILWVSTNSGAFCWYGNDSITYGTTYGAIYNWHAVNTNNLCPAGWHVATNNDWTILANYVGGATIAGGMLKEADTLHWNPPNTGAMNTVDFTALPGGNRAMGGAFDRIQDYGYWWSATEQNSTNAWSWRMSYNSTAVSNLSASKQHGYSVRCVMDTITTSLQEMGSDNSMHIYPNPATDIVYITYTNSLNNASMKMYTIMGECVLQKELDSGMNKIDIRMLPKGVYVINIIDSNGVFISRKLLKE